MWDTSRKRKKLGDFLLESGIIDEVQLAKALHIQKEQGGRLGTILVKNNFVDERQLLEVLEFRLGIPFIDLHNIEISPDMQKLVPYQIAEKYKVVPVKIENGMLYVAMEDPLDFIAIEDLKLVAKMEIAPVLSYVDSITSAINQLYGSEEADKAIKEFQQESGIQSAESTASEQQLEVDSAPIVRLVHTMIEQAVLEGTSDIHIEPMENEVRVRYRIDGKLQLFQTIPKNAHSAVITRIKIMSGLNIAEKRIPQDGRCDLTVRDKQLNLRVSTLPTVHGEKVVIRILDKSNFLIPKEKLGFTKENLEKFDRLLMNPHGIILITGPTGSGKSTTLYTMLSELNKISENIVTVEDPVEYLIPGLNQVQVNVKAGLTFASALRSFLRQDPDIIMLGEIRDSETADIAMRAAITGHLVLSTLHTNDAVSSISRLIDMGIEPFMVAVSLVGVISQRLVRKLCPRCAVDYKPPAHELKLLGVDKEDQVYKKPVGCSYCNNTGYKGRLAVHEVLVINNGHREMIAKNASVSDLTEYSIKTGMTTLKQECIKLLENGTTSVSEVLSVAYSQ
ncbi:MAG TPA: ATPase, T2SS/T4P/T4SS family [Candidatus Atribacteria bacterium]|nr:ATPase, T2SS/T4P/T4SS family [Candidatus Atribacteria bacterium]